MTARQFFIIVTGAAGSGKDEQVTRLIKRFGGERNINLLHTSKLLDDLEYTNPPLHQEMMGYRSQGKLVPNRITLPVVRQFFHELNHDRTTIANGFPRDKPQGEFLIRQLPKLGLDPANPFDCCVINIQVSSDECTRRMSLRPDRRPDSHASAISERRRVESDRIKAIELFRNLPGQHVHDVNGEQTIDQVSADIKKIIDRVIRKHGIVK